MGRLAVSIALLGALGAAGCSGAEGVSDKVQREVAEFVGEPAASASTPEERSPIVAIVGEQQITLAEFRRHWSRRGGPGQLSGDETPAQRETLARSALDRLVDERLLVAEAKRRGLTPDRKLIAKELERLEADHGERQLLQDVLESGELPAEIVARAADRLSVEALLSTVSREAGTVSANDIEAYYVMNQARFTRDEEVRALQIVVRTEEEAERVLKAIKGGESFRELARRHSIAPEASRGGDLGFFARGVMPRVFDENCFDLKVGKHTKTVPSDYGYHIFKVVERREPGVLPLIEVRDRIRDDLARARATDAETKLLARLRKEVAPRLFAEALEGLGSQG